MKLDPWTSYLVGIALGTGAGALAGWLHGGVRGAVVLGAVGLQLAAWLPILAEAVRERVELRRRPSVPRCARGRCSTYDRVPVEGGEVWFVCACGDAFVLRGAQFRRVLRRDGSTVPFRVRGPDGRWA